MNAKWPAIPLADIASNFDSRRVPLSSRERQVRPGPYPYYGATGIMDYIDDYLFDGLYVLIAEDGSIERPDGRPFVQLVDGRFWISNHAHVVQAQSKTDTKYLYFALSSINIRPYMTGSVQAKLSQANMNRIMIYWPNEMERAKIVNILSTLDDKIDLNRRMNETLEQMARAIFKSWFVDFEPVLAKMSGRWKKGESLPGLPARLWDLFPDRLVPSELGDIPEGWEIKTLSTLCRVQYGYTANAVQEAIGPKLLRVTDINKQNWIDWNSVPYCSISDKEKEKYSLKIGDIVVARMADPGKSAIIEEELNAVFASYLVRLKTDSLSMAYYIYGFLKSDLYKRYIAETSTGSVQPSMNAKVIVGTNLIVPTISLIESHFDLVLPIRHRIYKNLKESHTLSSIRDTALPKLIGGRMPLNID